MSFDYSSMLERFRWNSLWRYRPFNPLGMFGIEALSTSVLMGPFPYLDILDAQAAF
jgi:hypothetical protein